MPTPTILLIDYEPECIEAALQSLSEVGYRVEVATDGLAAVEAFRRVRPDLVLLEMILPKRHGFEVCQEIRKNDPDGTTPIVMMGRTATGTRYLIQALNAGANDFVPKPIIPEHLLEVCDSYLTPSLDLGRHTADQHAEGRGGDIPPPAARSSDRRGVDLADLSEHELMERLEKTLLSDHPSASPRIELSAADLAPPALDPRAAASAKTESAPQLPSAMKDSEIRPTPPAHGAPRTAEPPKPKTVVPPPATATTSSLPSSESKVPSPDPAPAPQVSKPAAPARPLATPPPIAREPSLDALAPAKGLFLGPSAPSPPHAEPRAGAPPTPRGAAPSTMDDERIAHESGLELRAFAPSAAGPRPAARHALEAERAPERKPQRRPRAEPGPSVGAHRALRGTGASPTPFPLGWVAGAVIVATVATGLFFGLRDTSTASRARAARKARPPATSVADASRTRPEPAPAEPGRSVARPADTTSPTSQPVEPPSRFQERATLPPAKPASTPTRAEPPRIAEPSLASRTVWDAGGAPATGRADSTRGIRQAAGSSIAQGTPPPVVPEPRSQRAPAPPDPEPAVRPSTPPARAEKPPAEPAPARPTPASEPATPILVPISELDSPPTTLTRSQPRYPEGARKKRDTEVVLWVLLNEAGRVAAVKPEIGKKESDLTAEAIRTVLTWTYTPPTRNGIPVKVWVTEKVTFRP